MCVRASASCWPKTQLKQQQVKTCLIPSWGLRPAPGFHYAPVVTTAVLCHFTVDHSHTAQDHTTFRPHCTVSIPQGHHKAAKHSLTVSH